ncbi:Smr/MutS family protein [Candidatus Peregrinibacteria bacterium]|jgi:DNA-nicking Smr family endonuclease|nr:Smr/MutS family protein [Candidatus Peregrinibacteria bacterium]MBT7736100.1 Smr/MutS family protein [Candidatus Peregrinibacteria bacterium]
MGKRKSFKNQKKEKVNKYDNLSKPEAEFDFHDRGVLTSSDMKKMADEFLSEARDRNLTKILFITGKGLHSRNGMPVIKPFLRKYLETLPFVLRVYEGRRDRGGAGTLEVTLSF